MRHPSPPLPQMRAQLRAPLLALPLVLAAWAASAASADTYSVLINAPTLDRWNYPFNPTPGTRITASTFGNEPGAAIFDNRDGQLFPNQFAQIELQLDTLKNTLVVPSASVQRGAQGSMVLVIQADSTVNAVPVQLLSAQDDWQAVQSDALKEGDSVVTDGADRLRSGSKVEVVKAAKP